MLIGVVVGILFYTSRSRAVPRFGEGADEAVKKGDAAIEKGDFDLAWVQYSEAIRLDPGNALGVYRAWLCLFK